MASRPRAPSWLAAPTRYAALRQALRTAGVAVKDILHHYARSVRADWALDGDGRGRNLTRQALYGRKFDEELELWQREIRADAYVEIKPVETP